MSEISFLSETLSFIFLLLICSLTYVTSKKFNLPYTVLLVLVWLFLVPISSLQIFSFIDDFKLTPEILFYVFLPILLFEWGYNINYRLLIWNWKSISLLSIVSLIISWVIISLVLFYLLPFAWFEIPYLICLLFWALISATDPVAVLSIFKTLWAPRRLTMIFEWESLFNDGTAVAFFLVVLWVILAWGQVNSFTYLEWMWKFFSMLFWWIVFWWFTWFLFSTIIWKIKNNEEAEIVITMLVAHFTFIFAELISFNFSFLPISWVIATVIASIVVWNYWKYKITPKVEKHMQKFWEFFAFIANSIVFILMWLILTSIDIDETKFILPVIITILTVMIVRLISVYIPVFAINKLKLEEQIPSSWTTLLSWWSLRWALALMMVLLIPEAWDHEFAKIMAFQDMVWWSYGFSIKEFLIVLTIWSIMFTLFVQAPLIPKMMRQLQVDKLHKLEEFEYDEWKILANLKIIEKINSSYKKAYITKIEYEQLNYKYSKKLNGAVAQMKLLLWEKKDDIYPFIVRALSLHALWIEKKYLKQLFLYNEIDEENFKYILRKIEREIEKVNHDHLSLIKIAEKWDDYDLFSKFFLKLYKRESTEIDSYIRNRTRLIITRKVIKDLRSLSEIDFWFDKAIFDSIIELYAKFNKNADEERIQLFASHKATINAIESNLIDKSLLKLEENLIEDLHEKDIITPKLYMRFINEIEDEMYSDVKKIK